MIQVKIGAVGNSAGVILPKDILARLGVQKGDTVQLDVEDGVLRIVKVDDAYNRAIETGRECFDRYPATMAELAR